MGRTVTSGLQALLDKRSCNTQSTLSLILAKGAGEYHFATEAFNTGLSTFTADLRSQDALQQSISTPTNRAAVRIQNVDKLFGTVITNEALKKAEASIGRYYRDENNLGATGEWVELFRGDVIPLEINEAEAILEIVHDLTAAGFCVGAYTLAENCQLVYKQADTCGSTSSEALCNKKRKSKHGCFWTRKRGSLWRNGVSGTRTLSTANWRRRRRRRWIPAVPEGRSVHSGTRRQRFYAGRTQSRSDQARASGLGPDRQMLESRSFGRDSRRSADLGDNCRKRCPEICIGNSPDNQKRRGHERPSSSKGKTA